MYYSVPGSYHQYRFSGSPSSVGSKGSTHVNDHSPSYSRMYQHRPSDETYDVHTRKGSGENQVATPPRNRSYPGIVDVPSASSSPTMDVFYDAVSTVSASSVDHIYDRFSFTGQESKVHLELNHGRPVIEVADQDSFQSLSSPKPDLKTFKGVIHEEPKPSPIVSSCISPITPVKIHRHRSHDTYSNTSSPDSQPHFIFNATSTPPNCYDPTIDQLLIKSLSSDLGLYEPIAGYLSYAPCVHPPLPCVSEQSSSSGLPDKAVSTGTAIQSTPTMNQVRSHFYPSQLNGSDSTQASAHRLTRRAFKDRFRRTPDRSDCSPYSTSAFQSSNEDADNHFANLSLGLLSDSSSLTTRRSLFSTCSSSSRKAYITKRDEKKRSGKKHRSALSTTLRDPLKKRARRMKFSKAQIR